MQTLEKKNRHYVTGIDGVRTLAVLGVIIYHLLPNVLQSGYLWVPLFLLISGYFITYQFSRRLEEGQKTAIGHFYLKRFHRLYPVLIAMLVLTTAYITLFARELLHHIRMILLTNVLWVYNWWEIKHGQSYFDQFGGASPFTHLWTMGVEAQFYLLWPILLILLFKVVKKRQVIRWLVLGLAVLSAIEMAVLYDPTNINRVYYGTDTRAFSLLLGSWLGLVWPLNRLNPTPAPKLRRALDIIGIGTVALTVFGFLTLNGQAAGTYRGGMFMYSLVGMVLIATILHPGSQMNKWFSNPVFYWVGKRSYGIYVYQYPVMIFYERLVKVGTHPLINALIELVIIGLISEASYRWLERPLANCHLKDLKLAMYKFPHYSQRGWGKAGLSTLVVLIALVGVCLPDRKPAKSAVQQRIEKNHQQATKHNRAIAKGKKVAPSKDTSKIQSQYSLTPQEAKAAQKLKITAIGDSVMADASDSIQQLMPNAYVDAQVGRQGSATPAVIKQLKAEGNLNQIVVLNLGTNGTMSQETIDQIINEIGPNRQIYWLTAHVPTKPWQQTVNQEINQAAKEHKNVHVVDWYTVSQNHSDWFASDNVHMGQSGNISYARLIAKSILDKQ